MYCEYWSKILCTKEYRHSITLYRQSCFTYANELSNFKKKVLKHSALSMWKLVSYFQTEYVKSCKTVCEIKRKWVKYRPTSHEFPVFSTASSLCIYFMVAWKTKIFAEACIKVKDSCEKIHFSYFLYSSSYSFCFMLP